MTAKTRRSTQPPPMSDQATVPALGRWIQLELELDMAQHREA